MSNPSGSHISILLLLFVGWFGALSPGYAQKNRSLHISPGIQYAAERDFGFSPLMFTGWQGFFSGAYSTEGSSKSDFLEVGFSGGSLANSYDTRMDIKTGSVLSFTFYHGSKDAFRGLHWGWSNHNAFSIRDNEAAINFNNRFDYFTSFGPAIRYRMPFELLKRNISFQALAQFQLIGFSIQSSYVSQGPRGYEREQNAGLDVMIRSFDLFYPGNSWNFSVWPALSYELESGTLLRFNYRFDYTSIKGSHLLARSQGKWFISIIAAI